MGDNNEQEAADLDAIHNNDGVHLFEVIYRGGRLDNDYSRYGEEDHRHNPNPPHYIVPANVNIRLIIHSSVTVIDTEACADCTVLFEVVFHENVTSIGRRAFYCCRNLRNIELLEGLLLIETGALDGCDSLRQIVIPASVQYVGPEAFRLCESLQRVTFTPKTTVVELGSHMFAHCTNLRFVTLPQNLQSISTGLFSYCTSLARLQISASVEMIEAGAFSCSGISSMKVSEEDEFIPGTIMLPPNVRSISENCFSNCQAFTNIRIPLSVEDIEADAFSDSGLCSIEISENVHQIGVGACRNCLFLERVTFHSSTNLTMTNNIFANCPLLSVINMYPWLWPKLFALMDDDDDNDDDDDDDNGNARNNKSRQSDFIFQFFRQYHTKIFNFNELWVNRVVLQDETMKMKRKRMECDHR